MTMDLPSWADEKTRRTAMKALAEYEMPEDFMQAELIPITNFSNLFAEYMVKDRDLLVHLFPRAGADDLWYPEEYRDGKYIPGRREEKSSVEFPVTMGGFIQDALNSVWMGEVATDYIPELGAYSIQFQEAKNTVNTVGANKFVDKFCEELDSRLE